MPLTNRHNLPQPLVRAVTRDPYSKGDADYSVTELIDSPRIRALQQAHADEIEEDVSERIFSLFGRAVHQILEWGADADHVAEERVFATINGVTISGGMDLQKIDTQGGVAIQDYKVTSVYSATKEKFEWEAQLNLYAALIRKTKNYRAKQLGIVAILRDWSKGKARGDYPEAPVLQIPIALWPDDAADSYLAKRIALHERARRDAFLGKPLRDCTPDERWEGQPNWAVMRKGAARASRVFGDELDAIAFAKTSGADFEVVRRGGEPRRCLDNYCRVSRWCDQWQKQQQETDNAGK